MIWMMLRRSAAGALVLSSLLLGAAFTAGCRALDVSDPTAIEDKELSDAAGAQLLRLDALRRLYIAVGRGALTAGLLTDEFLSDPPDFYTQAGVTSDEAMIDQRQSLEYENVAATAGGFTYGFWNETRRAATLAISKLRVHGTPAHVGEMFALRGLATAHLAEHFCPGIPLHDVVDFKPVYGGPLTTEGVFEHALAEFDSAVAYSADSARILNLAAVGRARALVGLGRYGEAVVAAAQVPPDFVANAYYSPTTTPNPALALLFGFYLARSVANEEGGTGLDYVAAGDSRVPTTPLGTAYDGVTTIYRFDKYLDDSSPIVLASGVEARLIEAEAALNGGGDWLAILNTLRTDGTQDGSGIYNPGTGGVPGLAPLADPGGEAARVDLLFRERAFWLFGTGHRLGDLRRLISRYGRQSESVFPAGNHRLGGVYGTATSIPFPAALETPHNPAVTGCTSR